MMHLPLDPAASAKPAASGPSGGATWAGHYPDWLEAYWVRVLQGLYPGQAIDGALGALRGSVDTLSHLFTDQRPAHFGNYTHTQARLLAYGMYFYPQAFVRAQFPVDEAVRWRGWRPPEHRPVCVVDLGAGLGASGLSIAHYLRQNELCKTVHLHAFDHSPQSLAGCKDIAAAHPAQLSGIRVHTHWQDLRKAHEAVHRLGLRIDVLVMGCSLNEAFGQAPLPETVSWIDAWKPYLAPGALVVLIEPALEATATALCHVATALTQKGWWELGPHLHAKGPCPMLADGRFFNHEVRRWQVPETLNILNRKLHRSLRELTFSYVTLCSRPTPGMLQPQQGHVFRLTSPFALTKSGFLFSGLTAQGTFGHYMLPVRGLSVAEKKSFRNYERGDIVCAMAPEPLKNPLHWRIRPDDLRCLYTPRAKLC